VWSAIRRVLSLSAGTLEFAGKNHTQGTDVCMRFSVYCPL
jgi:hypothetical protein